MSADSRKPIRPMKKGRNYVYTKFDALKHGDLKVNLIGVVSAVHDALSPATSVKTRKQCFFELVDETEIKIKCTILDSNRDYLPESLCCGDVVCLRKVAVEQSKGKMVVKPSAVTSWLLFKKQEGFKLSSDVTAAPGSSEIFRLNELTKWLSEADLAARSPKHPRLDSEDPAPSWYPQRLRDLLADSRPSSVKSPQPHTSSKRGPQPYSKKSPPPSKKSPQPHSSSKKSPQRDSAPSRVVPSSSSVFKPTKDRYYETSITKINELVVGKVDAATMGVLKYFKLPTKSSGRDHYVVLCLIDETNFASSGLSCVVFNPSKAKLPVPSGPGDVVMMKGLAINTYQRVLQGRGHENSLIGIFPTDPFAPLPEKIGDWYTMKPHEKIRVQELRSWAAKGQPLLINSRLEEMSSANYCSTVCLVVRVSVNERGTMVLSVCDGTTPKYPQRDPGILTTLTSTPTLDNAYLGNTSTVTLSPSLKPHVVAGDVVQLVNLCMNPSGKYVCAGVELMTLALQDSSRHQGALHILNPESEVVHKFREGLPRAPEPSTARLSPPKAEHVITGRLSTLIDCVDSQHATLADIERAPMGSMRVAEVQVTGVGKEICSTLEDICQLRCSGCKSLYMTPRPQDADFSRLLAAGDICVCCSADDLLAPNRLEYMYAFTIIVSDRTTQMELAVSGPEGKKFFSQVGLRPTNLYVDSESRHAHWHMLHKIAGGRELFNTAPMSSSPEHPSLNLCIAVYLSATNRRMYKVTNTTLCFV